MSMCLYTFLCVSTAIQDNPAVGLAIGSARLWSMAPLAWLAPVSGVLLGCGLAPFQRSSCQLSRAQAPLSSPLFFSESKQYSMAVSWQRLLPE